MQRTQTRYMLVQSYKKNIKLIQSRIHDETTEKTELMYFVFLVEKTNAFD